MHHYIINYLINTFFQLWPFSTADIHLCKYIFIQMYAYMFIHTYVCIISHINIYLFMHILKPWVYSDTCDSNWNHSCDLAFSIPLSVPTFVQIWEIALITDVLIFQSYKTSKLAAELQYNSPWRSKFANWCRVCYSLLCFYSYNIKSHFPSYFSTFLTHSLQCS